MNETFYKRVVEQAPTGYAYHKIILDGQDVPVDYEYIEVNRAFEKLTGLKRAEIEGKKMTDFFPDIKNASFDWIKYYGEVVLSGGEKEFEEYSEHLNKWFRVLIFSPEKERLITQFVDISHEKGQLEEINNFFEINLDLLCIADTGGNFIKLNKAWETILGYSTEDLLKINYLDFVHPDDIKETLKVMTKLNEQSQVLNFVNRYRRKDGTYRWIEWRSQPKGKLIYAAARDITEHKLLEATLRHNEDKYRRITENISDMVWATDLNLKTTYVSPSVKNLLGESIMEHLQHALEEKYPPESVRKMREVLQEELEKERDPAIDQNRTRLLDLEQYRADGKTIWVNMHVSFIRNNNGEVDGIQGVTRDISEQKKLQESLQREQLFNQKILDSLPGIFYLYTYPQLELVRYNNNHETLLGYETGEIANRHIMDWHIPEAKATVQQAVDDVMIQGHNVLESPLLSKEGEYVPFLMTGVSFDTPGQQYLMGIGVDLRERKKIEEQVYLEKELFKTTLLSVGDGVISSDQQGNVLLLNKVAEVLTGWTQDDALGKPLNEVFHIINEYTREQCENPVKKVLETGKIIELANHTILVAKDNSEKPIEDSAAPIRDEKGNTSGVVLVFRDFTDKKEKQDQIEYLSFHDQLTGLYNRRFYEEELMRLDTTRNLPLTIIMGDVNGLKLINDSFGHAMGDELLKKAAEIIKAGARADDIVSRVGGDEFVIILPQTDAFEAEQIIKRIMNLAAKEKVGPIDVSVSFGLETKIDEAERIQEIFKKAEDQMYNQKLFESPSMRGKTIDTIIKTLYEKNQREEQHSQRVSKLCERMGKVYGLSEYKISELKTVGLLHDIGKIAIDENILNKPGKLTEDERYAINRHSEIGYRILNTVNEMSEIAGYVLAHHERWDGTGYPKGLKANEIPFESSIIAIADAYDAMTSDRSYSKALPKEAALKELTKNAGIQFNPELVQIFIEKVLD